MRTRGFTLLEVLIYLALFSILISGVLGSLLTLMQDSGRTKKMLQTQEEALFITRKINWELTNAQSATLIDTSTLQIAPGDVLLRGEASNISISRGSSPAVALGSAATPISDVEFSVAHTPGEPDTVTARFTIDGKPFLFKKNLLQ